MQGFKYNLIDYVDTKYNFAPTGGTRGSVHPLLAVVKGGKKPIGPNDFSDFGDTTHINKNQNFSGTFTVVPGQTTLWYNDFGEYDEFIIVKLEPPPPDTLWETGKGDDRQQYKKYFLATGYNKSTKGQQSDLDIKSTHLGYIPYKGWGYYNLPSYVIKFKVLVFSHKSPDYDFGRTKDESSIWIFYIRNAKKSNGSHLNTKTLGY